MAEAGETERADYLSVRVTTRAGRDEIAGERDGTLLVRVGAPPADGRANEAVLRLIARALRVPPRDVELVRGARSREKLIRVAGRTGAEVLAQLAGR